MSPRVGTIVALVAAALLAISIASTAWWSGHPTVGDQELNRKTVNIGLFTGSQCNYADGDETDCRYLAVIGPVKVLKFIQLVFTVGLAVSLIALAVARDRRKNIAKLVMIAVALSMVMAVVMLAIGPSLGTGKSESIPINYSFVLFFIGTALAIGTATISLLPPRVPRPAASRSSLPAFPQQPYASAQQPAFDVEALLGDEGLRPSTVPHSPGGPLAGPAGPLAVPSSQPLFHSAPGLRPLYEASGIEPPPPAVQFPSRGPTPMPQAAVSAALGLDLPPPPPLTIGAKAPPPPMRNRPPSAAPPIPAIPVRLKPTTKPPPSPKPTTISAAVPPPRPSELPTSAFSKSDESGTSPDNVAFEDTAAARPFEEPNQNSSDQTNPAEKLEHTDPEPSIMTSATPPPRSSKQTPAVRAASVPITTAADDLPPPRAESSGGGPSPACPQCEAPMGWVEEHLRFYCKACKMYF